MSFEDQQREIQRHRTLHESNEPLTREYSCLICHPVTNTVPNNQFQNFWLFLSTYYPVDTYSAYTVTALPVYIHLFREEPTQDISERTVAYLIKLIFSIRFYTYPNSLHKLILEIFQLTHRTNYFVEPVTHDLYYLVALFLSSPPRSETSENSINSALVQENLNQNSLLFTQDELNLNSLFEAQPMTMNDQQLQTVLDNVLGQNGLNLAQLSTRLNAVATALGQINQPQVNAQVNVPARELSIIKVTDFHGKDEEDPHEWLDSFNQAATANRWTGNDRLLEIVKGYLKGAAADWIWDATDANAQNRVIRFAANLQNNGEADTSFDTRFIRQYASETKQNRWFYELMTLRQTSSETVNEYSLRFQRLLRKVATNQNIPDQMQIRTYP